MIGHTVCCNLKSESSSAIRILPITTTYNVHILTTHFSHSVQSVNPHFEISDSFQTTEKIAQD